MNKTFEYCKHQYHLINQGIHWCEKQVKDYPECCNKDCPYYEEIVLETITTTSTAINIVEANNELNKRRKETNKKRA